MNTLRVFQSFQTFQSFKTFKIRIHLEVIRDLTLAHKGLGYLFSNFVNFVPLW